ncbi:MAG: RagB/SusD family nutrient uptake outer membrane protein [Bacteroidetes bacterium]|nr:RagB/SusD family nutrient uptake outer membrane protein [Bacteroidota bacterium]
MKLFIKNNGQGATMFLFSSPLLTVRRVKKNIFCSPLYFLLLNTVFTGCKKFIDVPPPKTQIVTATVFDNNASATSAQLAIYTNMETKLEGYNLEAAMGLYSDELQNHSTNSNDIQLYTNSLLAVTMSNWDSYAGSSAGYYSYIYDANAVISGLQTTTGCSPAVKQQLTGEAYFIRAFWHFYLTNSFGAVPIVLTTNYTVNNKIARTSRVQVLQQVIADLKTAQSLLNNNYVDGSDTIVTTQRVRPTKAAAQALMARAYLYLGDYSNGNTSYYKKADSAATAVITNANYSLSPLNNVFLANSSESIWQLQTPPNQSYDTPEGFSFVLLGAPGTGSSRGYTTISNQLISSFEPGDQRKSDWVGSITEGANTYYFPDKYKNYTHVGTEYEMILRLGEQYLIRAEARAHEGNLTGSEADLNMIRNRAGLPNYAGPQDASSVLDAILHERQVELFTEWGARWYDLCRAFAVNPQGVNAVTVMGPPGNVCQSKGGSWSPNNYQLLFPIPYSNISSDPNLTQNTGY